MHHSNKLTELFMEAQTGTPLKLINDVKTR